MTELPGNYPIKAVARMTGLSPDVIRAWERRYGAIAPARAERRIRLYSEQDVERLSLLKEAASLGHAIGRIATLPDEALRQLNRGRPAAPPSSPSRLASRVIEAVERLDAIAADEAVSEAAALLPADALLDDVVIPLLREVGANWSRRPLGIATEHLTTGILRGLLGTLLRTRTIDRRHPPVLLATLPGEPHELGLLSAALRIASHGVPVCYLGPNVPAPELVDAARTIDVFAVGISLVLAPDEAQLAMLGRLADDLNTGIGLWLGGAGSLAIPSERLPRRAAILPESADLYRRLRARNPR